MTGPSCVVRPLETSTLLTLLNPPIIAECAVIINQAMFSYRTAAVNSLFSLSQTYQF